MGSFGRVSAANACHIASSKSQLVSSQYSHNHCCKWNSLAAICARLAATKLVIVYEMFLFVCLLHGVDHSKTHLICSAAGLRSDPLGELTALARPQH